LLTIYKWWKYHRRVEQLALEQERLMHYDSCTFNWLEGEKDLNKLKGKEKKKYDEEQAISMKLHKRDEQLDQTDTEMLARLAKIRHFMW
jgi:hypothetical protein